MHTWNYEAAKAHLSSRETTKLILPKEGGEVCFGESDQTPRKTCGDLTLGQPMAGVNPQLILVQGTYQSDLPTIHRASGQLPNSPTPTQAAKELQLHEEVL